MRVGMVFMVRLCFYVLLVAADGVQFVDQVSGNVTSKWEIFKDTQADGPQLRVLECPKGVSLVKKRLIVSLMRAFCLPLQF